MMKKILWAVPVIIGLSLLAVPRAQLVDIATGQAAKGFAVAWPATRYLLEPFVGLAAYVMSFTRYMVQIGSWLVWLGLLTALYNIARRRPALLTVKRVLFAWLACLSFVVFAILAPMPAPHLNKPDGYATVDLHSHTHFSHDGVVSPAQSVAYHRALGFDAFFATEHGHTASFAHFPQALQLRTVFPGMQVQTTERISLLVLADRPYNGDDFTHRSIKDVIEQAHARGFVVLCPHWWKWGRPAWEELAAAGIDGFEIYNAGYRKFSDSDRARLVQFCRERGLMTVGTTDWHGWGRISDVWTVAKTGAGNAPVFEQLRRRAPLQVLVNRAPAPTTMLRYVFEPWVGLYYYFGGLEAREIAGWITWIFLVYAAGLIRKVRWFRVLSAGLGMALTGAAACYIVRWLPLLPENQILGKLLAPVLLALGLGWFFFAWRGSTADGE
jgi:hypothetical protein